MGLAFSVDLEPNQDFTFDGVADAMDWYDEVVPRGTIYTTYLIATERPGIVADLAVDHEIGVHVHPQEFDHDADDLAALSTERQRELVETTRAAVAEAAGCSVDDLTAFRAGRHKASRETLSVLADLGFDLDASVNIRYRDYMPAAVTDQVEPFEHESGLVEFPTTYGEPPLLSRVGIRTALGGNVTATAHELRSDRRGCSGLRALSWLFETTPTPVSMYMHPYDATNYEGLENDGDHFRNRLETLFERSDRPFVTASEVCESVRHGSHE